MLALFVISTICTCGLTLNEQGLIVRHFLDKTGTYFELSNSKYLNLTITSTATVHVSLSAPPETIYYFIESADGSDSTTLTLSNLQPSVTYYMYEDGYVNQIVFTTNGDGSYTYEQDLSKSHQVFIQTSSSTTFIYENTTLTHDIYGSVQIGADNIVLDLNGYSVIGSDTGTGIYFSSRQSTVMNGTVKGFSYGISLGSMNTIANTTIYKNFIGVLGWYLSNNTISGNNITKSGAHGIFMWCGHGNKVYGNAFSENLDDGIFMAFSNGNNKIFHNNFIGNLPEQAESWWPNKPDAWDDSYPSGGNYWYDYKGVDFYGGPYQNVSGSDGIGDSSYEIITMDLPVYDRYPLMSPWTPAATVKEVAVTIAGKTYQVQLVSNSTISDVAVSRNILHFDVSGPEGALAYVSAVLPVGMNTTNIKVFLNGKKLTPPPYPVIATNGTHYFVYFAVTFASFYDVALLFAPINAIIDQKPDALNLESEGEFIAVYIELPESYNVKDIDIFSIILNGTVAIDSAAPIEIGDYDCDGTPDLMVKFKRAEVISYICTNVDLSKLSEEKFISVTFTTTGRLNDATPFQGSDTVKIILAKNWGLGSITIPI